MKSLYKKWCQKPRRECWSTERTEHPIWTPGFTDLLHICLDIKVVLRQGFGSQDKIITQLHHSYLKRELSDTFDALILNIYSREVKWIVDWFQMEIDNWQATQVLSINAIYRYGEENSVRPEVCSTSRTNFSLILKWSNKLLMSANQL